MAKQKELTFEDFQKKKQEYLEKKKEIKERTEEDGEDISYPEIFAKEEAEWIKK